MGALELSAPLGRRTTGPSVTREGARNHEQAKTTKIPVPKKVYK